MLGKYKEIILVENASVVAAIRRLCMAGVAKNRLLERVNGIYAGDKCHRKRPQQDSRSWSNFGTRILWQGIFDAPAIATEAICQHLSSLGLISPSETTSVNIAAHIFVAEMGPMAANISQHDAKALTKR